MNQAVTFVISGMSCASCASRLEKGLNALDGIQASVNFATEKARVLIPDGMGVETVTDLISQMGFRAKISSEATTQAGASTDGEAGSEEIDSELMTLRQRWIGSILLATPVILMAMIPPLQFTYWQWASLTLAAPVVTWGAWPFHRAAWANIRHGATTMDTLVSIGTGSAFLWSLYALFLGTAGHPGMKHGFDLLIRRSSDPTGDIYLEVAAGVTMFLLSGRYFEKRSKRRASAAIRALFELGAKEVSILREGVEERIAVEYLARGDVFIARPGEKIATDGIIVEGRSAVDRSMLTGESIPVDIYPGEAVTGGSLNISGRLLIRATQVGAETQLAQMAKLVEEAQSGKAKIQRLADKISGIFVPVVILIAMVTLATWLLLGHGVSSAVTASVAVLIIACPCALGLATPTALLVGTGRGAQLGILIRGPEVLEGARRIDTIVLDKTGTVTTGKMTVVRVVASDGEKETEVLRMAGALEAGSEHPIAKAIVRHAWEEDNVPLPIIEDFENVPGKGAIGKIEGRSIWVGREALLNDFSIPLSEDLRASKAQEESMGRTTVLVAWEGKTRGVISVADQIKPTSAAAVQYLGKLGLTPILLTGDHETVARQVADEVGINEVIAGVFPADKARVVQQLQEKGRVVAMVGDGVNDSPALAQADIGLAMGSGTDAAMKASDLTLMRDDLWSVPDAMLLSRKTLQTIRGNLFWAFAYNVAAIPLAAFGLLNPMIAGAAMAFSSVFVVGNSLRLRKFQSVAPKR